MVADYSEIEDALTVRIPSGEVLLLEDSRRITGPGMLWSKPGAVLDVFFNAFENDKVVQLWQEHARKVLDAIGWQNEDLIARPFDGGVNLAVSAPMDQLYSAIFIAQTAWHYCAANLLGETPDNFEGMIADLKRVMLLEANPALIDLINAANQHGVDVLCDDDDISLGHGTGSVTYGVFNLPTPDAVNWENLHDVPVAMITGTNGKTTTTRLAAAIGKAAGLTSGLTSTEFVRVGEDILDKGDYSGPGGGRMLLRDQRLEIAYLEVARGGILRRGLPLRQARAAVVTNVAADHLGQYGVNTVEELAIAKFAVHRTLAADGILVLNADDPYVVNEAKNTKANFLWFSLNPDAPQILDAKKSQQNCAWFDGTSLMYFDGVAVQTVMNVADIPLTLNGAALYNVSNALAALCLSRAMGLSDEAIKTGLSSFKSDPKDNPGRCNEFSVNGARVFVDFAHNPHSIEAITKTMSAVPAKRRFVMLSHAGDRSDQDIKDVTKSALALNPDFVMAVELEVYLRGREIGAVPDLIEAECLKNGLTADQVLREASPLAGTKAIINQLQEGDLALLLALSERDEIFDLLS